MLIDTVTLYRFSLPLIEPYKLAMGAVGAFDTVLAVIEDDGGTGFGEATILTGYTEETIDGCWRVARGLIDNAGKMNGFLKPRVGIFAKPIVVDSGTMVLETAMPKLSRPDTLAALATETAHYPES